MPQPIIMPQQESPWKTFGTKLLQQNILLGLHNKYANEAEAGKDALIRSRQLDLERRKNTEKMRQEDQIERAKLSQDNYKPTDSLVNPEKMPNWNHMKKAGWVVRRDTKGGYWVKQDPKKYTSIAPTSGVLDTATGKRTPGAPKPPELIEMSKVINGRVRTIKVLPASDKHKQAISKGFEEGKLGGAQAKTTTNIYNQIQGEKFDIQKEQTMSKRRQDIITNKKDPDVFRAKAPMFNRRNINNEVAYWDDTGKGVFKGHKAEIVKLPQSAISAGWTPSEVQDKANETGQTVKQVLMDIGVLK